MTSTGPLAKLVTELAATTESATPIWSAHHALLDPISRLRDVITHTWARHEPRIGRHQGAGYEEDLAETLIRYANSLAELGLRPTIDTYSPADIDAHLARHINDYNPDDVAEQIDSIENVVGWDFTDTRERLSRLLVDEGKPTLPAPRPAPRYSPSHPSDRASGRHHCLRGSLVPVSGHLIGTWKDVTSGVFKKGVALDHAPASSVPAPMAPRRTWAISSGLRSMLSSPSSFSGISSRAYSPRPSALNSGPVRSSKDHVVMRAR